MTGRKADVDTTAKRLRARTPHGRHLMNGQPVASCEGCVRHFGLAYPGPQAGPGWKGGEPIEHDPSPNKPKGRDDPKVREPDRRNR